jgi:DNA repair protein RecN (Recombination protein N)
VQAIDPSLDAIVVALQDMATTLNETATQVARMLGDLEEDAEDLAGVEDRLAVITSLKRKYGPTSEDVVTYRKTAGERHDELAAVLDASETLDVRVADATEALEGAGRALREHRAAAAATISDVARGELKDLGFRDPIVDIVISHAPSGPLGADTASVRFASDASLEPGLVSAIASGGELSRLVLALTLASGASDASVIAFDEIDTGIGGSTALAMGEKLASLAASRQVICVTHLPQVAAFADLHLSVSRSGAAAKIVELGPEERLTELTRMLAGLSQSETGRVHAEELLAIAQRHEAD